MSQISKPAYHYPPSIEGSRFSLIYLWVTRPVDFFERVMKSPQRDLFSVRLFGPKHRVVMGDPELIQHVFKENPPIFQSGKFSEGFRSVLGDHSLFVLDEREHQKARKMLMPAFHKEGMRQFGQQMLSFTEKSLKSLKKGETFSMLSFMQELTFDMILNFIFDAGDDTECAELKEALSKEVAALNRSPWLYYPRLQRDLGPLTPWRAFLKLQEEADRLIFELIQKRRTSGVTSTSRVLAHLLSAVDEAGQPLSDQEIRDHLMTLLLAGHETTATALSWAFRWILADPAIHSQLKQHLERLWASPDNPAEAIAQDDYLDAVVKESLRLVPTIPGVGRELKEDFKMGDYFLPAGTVVCPSAYLTHRNPKYFKEPNRFMPERFIQQETHSPFDYFPFGGGRRRCIGLAFATYEMKMILAVMLHSLELELTPNQNLKAVRSGVTLIPASGTRVKIIDLKPTP